MRHSEIVGLVMHSFDKLLIAYLRLMLRASVWFLQGRAWTEIDSEASNSPLDYFTFSWSPASPLQKIGLSGDSSYEDDEKDFCRRWSKAKTASI